MGEDDEKKVLIIGGAGFIGQSLVRNFQQAGVIPCLFDLKPNASNYRRYIEGDVFDFEKLRNVVNEHNVVIHLAGLADAGAAQKEPAKSFRLNVQSLNSVLESCRSSDAPRKLIFPSSAAIYGQPEILPIKENFPARPTNIYSWHKYVCEEMIRAYHDNFGLRYVILRLFNVYGKRNKGVINTFLRLASRGETITSFGPYQYRDFVYAGDVAEAFFKSAMYEKANNRVINIGSGTGTQIKEILDMVCDLYPRAEWVHEKKEFETYDSVADTTLAKILLDFRPHDTKEFMRKIIQEEMMEDL